MIAQKNYAVIKAQMIAKAVKLDELYQSAQIEYDEYHDALDDLNDQYHYLVTLRGEK